MKRPERALLLLAAVLAGCVTALVIAGHSVPAVLAWSLVAALSGAIGVTVPGVPR